LRNSTPEAPTALASDNRSLQLVLGAVMWFTQSLNFNSTECVSRSHTVDKTFIMRQEIE